MEFESDSEIEFESEMTIRKVLISNLNIMQKSSTILAPFLLSVGTKSPFVMNLATIVSGLISAIIGMNFGELAKEFPVGGGNVTYLKELLPLGAVMIYGGIYSFLLFPATYSIFITSVSSSFLINEILLFYCLLIVKLVLFFIPLKLRQKIVTMVFVCKIYALAIMLFLFGLGVYKKIISQETSYLTSHLYDSFTFMEFVQSVVIGFYLFSGFDSCNFLNRVKFKCNLKKAYIISISVHCILLLIIINSILFVSSPNSISVGMTDVFIWIPSMTPWHRKIFKYAVESGFYFSSMTGLTIVIRNYIDNLIVKVQEIDSKKRLSIFYKSFIAKFAVRTVFWFLMHLVSWLYLYLKCFSFTLAASSIVSLWSFVLSLIALIKIKNRKFKHQKFKNSKIEASTEEGAIAMSNENSEAHVYDSKAFCKNLYIPILGLILTCILAGFGTFLTFSKVKEEFSVNFINLKNNTEIKDF